MEPIFGNFFNTFKSLKSAYELEEFGESDFNYKNIQSSTIFQICNSLKSLIQEERERKLQTFRLIYSTSGKIIKILALRHQKHVKIYEDNLISKYGEMLRPKFKKIRKVKRKNARISKKPPSVDQPALPANTNVAQVDVIEGNIFITCEGSLGIEKFEVPLQLIVDLKGKIEGGEVDVQDVSNSQLIDFVKTCWPLVADSIKPTLTMPVSVDGQPEETVQLPVSNQDEPLTRKRKLGPQDFDFIEVVDPESAVGNASRALTLVQDAIPTLSPESQEREKVRQFLRESCIGVEGYENVRTLDELQRVLNEEELDFRPPPPKKSCPRLIFGSYSMKVQAEVHAPPRSPTSRTVDPQEQIQVVQGKHPPVSGNDTITIPQTFDLNQILENLHDIENKIISSQTTHQQEPIVPVEKVSAEQTRTPIPIIVIDAPPEENESRCVLRSSVREPIFKDSEALRQSSRSKGRRRKKLPPPLPPLTTFEEIINDRKRPLRIRSAGPPKNYKKKHHRSDKVMFNRMNKKFKPPGFISYKYIMELKKLDHIDLYKEYFPTTLGGLQKDKEPSWSKEKENRVNLPFKELMEKYLENIDVFESFRAERKSDPKLAPLVAAIAARRATNLQRKQQAAPTGDPSLRRIKLSERFTALFHARNKRQTTADVVSAVSVGDKFVNDVSSLQIPRTTVTSVPVQSQQLAVTSTVSAPPVLTEICNQIITEAVIEHVVPCKSPNTGVPREHISAVPVGDQLANLLSSPQVPGTTVSSVPVRSQQIAGTSTSSAPPVLTEISDQIITEAVIEHVIPCKSPNIGVPRERVSANSLADLVNILSENGVQPVGSQQIAGVPISGTRNAGEVSAQLVEDELEPPLPIRRKRISANDVMTKVVQLWEERQTDKITFKELCPPLTTDSFTASSTFRALLGLGAVRQLNLYQISPDVIEIMRIGTRKA